ncbi:MAG: VCBS repeat-containing protein, partial [Candidatus Latescibacterota bacterium]
MKGLRLLALLLAGTGVLNLVLAVETAAVTWSFEERGNALGWHAREGYLSGSASGELRLLALITRDGLLRVPVPGFEYLLPGLPRCPALELISPQIGYSAGLFDRLLLRLRVLHPKPLRGLVQLRWTNADNQQRPGDTAHSVQQSVTFSTQWQQLQFAALSLGATQGGLDDRVTEIRLQFQLYEGTVAGPPDVPEAVEVDWVILTGVEEQIQGELPPPSAPVWQEFGELFAAARFQPLERRGIGSASGDLYRKATLGDVDGDQDLDLCAVWEGYYGEGEGWLAALNDGTGVLRTERIEPLPSPFLDAADLNRDGLLDLMLASGPTTYLLENAIQSDLSAAEAIEAVWPLGLGDGDGDGQADLWVYSCSSAGDCQSL